MSVSESIDTKTPSGQLVLNVLMSVAEWELATIRQRTKAALAEKRRRGEQCGRHAPYGFDVEVVDNVKRLTPNSKEQEAIELMQTLRDLGSTYREIGEELLAQGHRPKLGDGWDPGSIRKILLRIKRDEAA